MSQDWPNSLTTTALWALRVVAMIMDEGFTGQIQINCSQGGVTSVQRAETLKPPRNTT